MADTAQVAAPNAPAPAAPAAPATDTGVPMQGGEVDFMALAEQAIAGREGLAAQIAPPRDEQGRFVSPDSPVTTAAAQGQPAPEPAGTPGQASSPPANTIEVLPDGTMKYGEETYTKDEIAGAIDMSSEVLADDNRYATRHAALDQREAQIIAYEKQLRENAARFQPPQQVQPVASAQPDMPPADVFADPAKFVQWQRAESSRIAKEAIGEYQRAQEAAAAAHAEETAINGTLASIDSAISTVVSGIPEFASFSDYAKDALMGAAVKDIKERRISVGLTHEQILGVMKQKGELLAQQMGLAFRQHSDASLTKAAAAAKPNIPAPPANAGTLQPGAKVREIDWGKVNDVHSWTKILGEQFRQEAGVQ